MARTATTLRKTGAKAEELRYFVDRLRGFYGLRPLYKERDRIRNDELERFYSIGLDTVSGMKSRRRTR
jgi:hypothetical protein